jgi:uncharacterized surface protein with fasciclin (FAS1) repeats
MAIALTSCADRKGKDHTPHQEQENQRQERLVVGQLVAETETLARLADLVDKAGLTDALSARGPITVFAPSDTAIGGLSAAMYDDIVKPENRSQLRALLPWPMMPTSPTQISKPATE